MKFIDLVAQARTCRRYSESPVTLDMLERCVDCARLAPSARNQQVLRFAIVSSAEQCRLVGKTLRFGGALKPEQRPTESQMPRGYIIILGPENPDAFTLMDVGIAAQTMFLAAANEGLACCMVGAIKKPELASLLSLPQNLSIQLVLAVGSPAEARKIVSRRPDGSLTYYRNERDEHCVPKITLDEAIVIRL
ncbi:MAG: nitroreductase family protein [Mailhella sp.]|nr:nitroreductase family protein [Mailhella sp.]